MAALRVYRLGGERELETWLRFETLGNRWPALGLSVYTPLTIEQGLGLGISYWPPPNPIYNPFYSIRKLHKQSYK